MPTSSRSYTARHFKLNLAGVDAGFLKSVEGGQITADVISGPAKDGFRTKQLGPARLEPFTVECDLAMDKVVYDWIAQSWENVGKPKDGSIVEFDDGLDVKSERHFHGARILETTIPAVDASSKEGGLLTVTFQPESIEFTKASKASGASAGPKAKQTPWLKCNFRLDIAGLDCTKVSKIDSFTVKQIPAETSTEFPNLKITLAESAAQKWIDWHENFVIKGNGSDERSGSLAFLSPNLLTEVGRINFFNLGILKIAPERYEAGSEKIRYVIAELYCERMEFQYGDAKIGPGSDLPQTPDTGADSLRTQMHDQTERMLKPALERVSTDPQFRARLELRPLEALDELGVSLDAGTRAELAGKRFSEFWAARRKAVEGPVEVRDLPPEEDVQGKTKNLNVLKRGTDVTFAPPYVWVGP